jgi:hypothetical protein
MEKITNIAIAVFTAILAWATYRLAQYTNALSNLTRSLVSIEENRDKVENQRQRLNDLRKALEAAEFIQQMYPASFVTHLPRPDMYPEKEIEAIQTLQSLKKYIDDPDAILCLNDLCNDFDNVRRDKRDYRGNNETTIKNIQTIQIKTLASIKKWRDEISRAG